VCISHLKLIFNLAGVGLRVQSADVVVDGSEFTHWDSRVPTQTRFQNGIMHKHILLLQREREREINTYKKQCGTVLERDANIMLMKFSTMVCVCVCVCDLYMDALCFL